MIKDTSCYSRTNTNKIMELIKGFTAVLLVNVIFLADSAPIPNSTIVASQNSTIQFNTMNATLNSMQLITFDHLIASANDAIFYLVQDCQKFQTTLVSRHLHHIDMSSIVLSFPELNLDAIQCQSYQLVERIRLQAAVLRRFLHPMQEISHNLHNDVSQGTTAKEFSQFQNAFQWLMVLFEKMLSSLLISINNNAGSSSTATTNDITVQQLQQLTKEYLKQNHKNMKLSTDDVTAIRNFSFVRDIIRVAVIIKSELSQSVITGNQ